MVDVQYRTTVNNIINLSCQYKKKIQNVSRTLLVFLYFVHKKKPRLGLKCTKALLNMVLWRTGLCEVTMKKIKRVKLRMCSKDKIHIKSGCKKSLSTVHIPYAKICIAIETAVLWFDANRSQFIRKKNY